LTIQEQYQLVKKVRQMIQRDRQRRTKVKQLSMSTKSAKELEQRDFEELKDLLKELG
jgi:hypothetical protein